MSVTPSSVVESPVLTSRVGLPVGILLGALVGALVTPYGSGLGVTGANVGLSLGLPVGLNHPLYSSMGLPVGGNVVSPSASCSVAFFRCRNSVSSPVNWRGLNGSDE